MLRQLKKPSRLFNAITLQDWSKAIQMVRKELAMTNTYRVRYTLNGLPVIEDFQASSPISALNFFHRKLQILKDHKPKEYVLNGISLFYNANASGQPLMVESAYDAPKTDNPDLKEIYKVTRPEDTEAFGFLATTPTREIPNE